MKTVAATTALLSYLPAPAGAQCPLRALRENVRTQCGVEALLHCPAADGAAWPGATMKPFPPPSLFLPAPSAYPDSDPPVLVGEFWGGPGTFDGVVEEMVGAAMAVFDEVARGEEAEGDAGEETPSLIIPLATAGAPPVYVWAPPTTGEEDEEAEGDSEDREAVGPTLDYWGRRPEMWTSSPEMFLASRRDAPEHDVRLPEISSEMWGDSAAPPSEAATVVEGRDDTPDFAVPPHAVAEAEADVPRPDGERDEGEGLVFQATSDNAEDFDPTSTSEDGSEDAPGLPLPAAPLDAGDAALAALDDMVGTLFRSFLFEDDERVEHRKRQIDAPPDLLDVLPRALSDFGTVLISEDRERRRLSEGAADPRSEARERIGRRLTEYVRMTETYFGPGGGSVTFHTTTALPDLALSLRGPQPPSRKLGDGVKPGLGFATAEVDRCLYDRYLEQGLSRGCTDAVRGLDDMKAKIHDRRMARMLEGQSAGRAVVEGPRAVHAVWLASAGLAALLVAARCLGAATVLWSLSVAASVAAFGYWTLLVAVPLAFLFDHLRGEDDDDDKDGEENEDEAGFDYHECPGNEEGRRGQGRRDLRPVPPPPAHGEQAVYEAVPIQVV